MPMFSLSLLQLQRPDASGVISSPVSTLVSYIALTPNDAWAGESSGRRVLMLIVAPMPPDGTAARPVLYTSMPDTPSDARLDMSKARLVNVPYSPSPPLPTPTTSHLRS